VLPGPAVVRLFAVAAVIVAIYVGLIARVERITPRSVLHALRGVPDPALVPAPEAAAPERGR
jgi:hypothetical protein